MTAREVNFDGLVGPTHNYGGLAFGNLASEQNVDLASSPKAAAKQGLRKMKAVHDLGVLQAVLPPQDRPAVHVLRGLGFRGRDDAILRTAWAEAPRLLVACSSASSMWAANAATVAPSADSRDGRVHFTPANLRNNLHRAIETPQTARSLRAIFADPGHFIHHDALPGAEALGDEGAANHTRLCGHHEKPGVHLFVFGSHGFERDLVRPVLYPARQTFEASLSVSRLHQLRSSRVVFARQHPLAIDSGVFHNDVIAVGNQNVLLVHEQAFADQRSVEAELRTKLSDTELRWVEATRAQISIEESVRSYLFNSQLLTLPTGKMALLVPVECRESVEAWAFLQELLAAEEVVDRVEVVDLRQSMKNGGGPACLRLRIVLTADELAAVNRCVFLDDRLFESLDTWIETHYRDRLTPEDLSDPKLLDESRTALDELTQILALGSIYRFQRESACEEMSS